MESGRHRTLVEVLYTASGDTVDNCSGLSRTCGLIAGASPPLEALDLLLAGIGGAWGALTAGELSLRAATRARTACSVAASRCKPGLLLSPAAAPDGITAAAESPIGCEPSLIKTGSTGA